MAYRNGTYVAFAAEDTADPSASDRKYYELLKAWKVREAVEFEFVNSHEKGSSVRDSSKKETLRRSLVTKLCNSKNMILIVGEATRYDTDWVPFEIEYAVDECKIPIVAAYIDYINITAPSNARPLWPQALADRIDSKSARVIHVSFRQEPLKAAVNQFDVNNPPSGSLAYYTLETYGKWGLAAAS